MNRLTSALLLPEPTIGVVVAETLAPHDLIYIEQRAGVYELRADILPMPEALRLGSLPLLGTVRSEDEGGYWSGTEQERLVAINALLEYTEVDGVDVEVQKGILRPVIEHAHDLGKIVVASSHDFTDTPSIGELEDRLGQAQEAGADFFKVAALADTPSAYSRLRDFTKNHRDDNVIVVGMGSFGRESRKQLPRLGSRMTYVSYGKAVVNGQLTLDEAYAEFSKAS